jgi:hypothetical protein
MVLARPAHPARVGLSPAGTAIASVNLGRKPHLFSPAAFDLSPARGPVRCFPGGRAGPFVLLTKPPALFCCRRNGPVACGKSANRTSITLQRPIDPSRRAHTALDRAADHGHGMRATVGTNRRQASRLHMIMGPTSTGDFTTFCFFDF